MQSQLQVDTSFYVDFPKNSVSVCLSTCGLLHKAGFSFYPCKFNISLNKLCFFGLKKMDWFLAGFIGLVPYATRLTFFILK